MKQYRLLKDLPDLNAGEILHLKNGIYEIIDSFRHSKYRYAGSFVEHNSEWFEEVWQCAKCNKYFNENNILKHNYEVAKDGKFYYCDECSDNQNIKYEIEKINIKPNGWDDPDSNASFSEPMLEVRNKINEIIDWINKQNKE